MNPFANQMHHINQNNVHETFLLSPDNRNPVGKLYITWVESCCRKLKFFYLKRKSCRQTHAYALWYKSWVKHGRHFTNHAWLLLNYLWHEWSKMTTCDERRDFHEFSKSPLAKKNMVINIYKLCHEKHYYFSQQYTLNGIVKVSKRILLLAHCKPFIKFQTRKTCHLRLYTSKNYSIIKTHN